MDRKRAIDQLSEAERLNRGLRTMFFDELPTHTHIDHKIHAGDNACPKRSQYIDEVLARLRRGSGDQDDDSDPRRGGEPCSRQ